jgi:hypothetical protein
MYAAVLTDHAHKTEVEPPKIARQLNADRRRYGFLVAKPAIRDMSVKQKPLHGE